MHDHSALFHGLIDLAASVLGGATLACSDDFFAPMHNLLEPGRGEFIPDRYTERGKWMDGWESRRRSPGPKDWCVIRLGCPGEVRAVDIDTNHFLGNHPPYAAVLGTCVDGDPDADTDWTEVVPQSPLRPGSRNLFLTADVGPFTHLRLDIFPDGGVARFRAFGRPDPVLGDWRPDPEAAMLLDEDETDLAALVNGGIALACSDSFFGPMNNLILPGRAENMGGGWETRRRRGAGHDWILLRLGGPGSVGMIEVDTNHFKGNFPDRCAVDGLHAPGLTLTELVDPNRAWKAVLPETELSAHHRHFFRDSLENRGPFTHVRLRIDPDGGVSRLRVYGRPE